MRLKTKVQEEISLQFGLFLAIIFLIVQIAMAYTAVWFEGHRLFSFFFLSLIGLAAGCAGWGRGIVLTPLGNQSNGAQKVLVGFDVFWTGVIAGHLPQLSDYFNGWKNGNWNERTEIEVLFGAGIFLLASCVTFNTRFEDSNPGSRPEAKDQPPGIR
jgi:hypothetical protein